jgi:preprotein translocase subunit SecY
VTLAQLVPSDWLQNLAQAMGPGSWIYLLGEVVLIIAFTYFYTSVQFNPLDQADNLKKYGGFIPGIRPGRPTAEYLDRVLTRITFPGAVFLASIAVLPTLLIRGLGVPFYFGGTMKQMESQLLMRHYEGFLK